MRNHEFWINIGRERGVAREDGAPEHFSREDKGSIQVPSPQ